MSRRRSGGGQDANPSTPVQQDESEIIEEAGAVQDEELGALVTDEDRIRALGAVDADSVRENRRLDNIVRKKRGGVKDVPFNVSDVITKYDTLIKFWPVNTIDITVIDLTGNNATHTIRSRPRSGMELYDAIMQIHGQSAEAKYEIKFFDSNSKEFRGTGQITLRDARPPTPQQGQPMQYPPPGYPPGYPPPQGYPPQGYPPQMYPQQPPQAAPQGAQPAQQQPAAPPQVFVQPPAGPDPMAMMNSVFEMFQRWQQQMSPQQPMMAAQPPFVPPPPPPPGADMNAMMAWASQLFEMWQKMNPNARGAVHHHAQQPQMPPMMNAAPMGMPAMQPPPGTTWMYVPGPGGSTGGWIAQPMGGGVGVGGGGAGPTGSPYGQQRPPYFPGRGGPPPPHMPPQREKTAAEQWREAITTVKSAFDMVQEMNELMPGAAQGNAGAAQQEAPDDDDSPMRIVETGPVKLAINKEDGTLRTWESGLINLPDIFKWAGEQYDKVRKAQQEEQRRQQQPRRVLPPGYVEVDADYKPPPGYVAVPVDPNTIPQSAQQGFTPPPTNIPPPIQSAPGKTTWEAPVIPGQGGS